MKLKDLVIMSLRNLFRRKMRTFLAILSVVIGSSSIILMLSLGFGLRKSFRDMLSNTSDLSIIKIRPSYETMGHTPKTGGINKKENLLDDNFVKTLRSWKEVETAIPVIRGQGGIIVTGKKINYPEILAINPEDMKNMGYFPETGRLLMEGDKDVVVLGYDVARNFQDSITSQMGIWNPNQKPEPVDINKPFIFTYDYSYGQPEDPWASEMEVEKYPVHKIKVVGILKESQDWEVGYAAIMPIKTHEKFLREKEKVESENQSNFYSGNSFREKRDKNKYSYIILKVKDPEKVDEVNERLKAMNYPTDTALNMLDNFNEFTNVIQLVLGGIGGISLIVAAIGITNTMIMSIYERTKEIGVMKVIGASIQDIRNLFLIEAAFIGGIGGLTGGVLSFIASFGISKFLAKTPLANEIGFLAMTDGEMTQMSYVPWWLVVAAVLITALVGVVAGYFPARRATKLSALDAIRSN